MSWTPGDGPREEIDPAARTGQGDAAGSEGMQMGHSVAHLTIYDGSGPPRERIERLSRPELERRYAEAMASADRTLRRIADLADELASARAAAYAAGCRQCERCEEWCLTERHARTHCAHRAGPEDGPGRAA